MKKSDPNPVAAEKRSALATELSSDDAAAQPAAAFATLATAMPVRLADHCTQANLFDERQTEVERAHIIHCFRIELSKVTVPANRERMLASLMNMSPRLAAAVAEGLGLPVPAALPLALKAPNAPGVTVAAALTPTALPGTHPHPTREADPPSA